MVADNLYLLCGVKVKEVKGYHYGLTKAAKVLYVPVKVFEPLSYALRVWRFYLALRYSAVHLKCLCCCYKHGKFWIEPGFAAFDVEEFLCAKVCSKACLCYGVV